METKKFQTETKRLLDLMINSIYTNKEIFIRELISNASDAIDKRHYLSLTDERYHCGCEYEILIDVNEEERTITISDNGIGMNYDEVVNNLGTIAKSGSKEFIKTLGDDETKTEIDIIGQFGVGFYSAFMVSDKVVVETRSVDSENGYRFSSDGSEEYTIEEIEKPLIGTKITVYLRENLEDEDYDKFLDEYTVKQLVKKYSDYIRYPIRMNIKSTEPILDDEGKPTGEYSETVELQTLNSMVPIWKKNKSEVTDEELNQFYKSKFNDYEEPIINVFTSVEGNLTYNALCFIPSHTPYDLYSDTYEKGLQLYTKGVFILDKCKELIPNYLRFVKGLVDSADLSLNISREMLQHDRQLSKIASNLEKKILAELTKTLRNDREKYEKFFKVFGLNIKYGLYEDYGMRKYQLKDLVLFESANQEGLLTLAEYVSNMKEGQECIYYASGKTKASILAQPQMDAIKNKDYDVLVLTDDVDEFMISVLAEYEGKKFKSINSGDLDLLSDEEEKAINDLEEAKKPLLTVLTEALNGEVKEVVLSKRLTTSPVCLVSGEGVSFEMERVMNKLPNDYGVKADKILEINPNHEIFKAIETLYEAGSDDVGKYAKLLYSQALLIEGIMLENPMEFANLMCELMVKKV